MPMPQSLRAAVPGLCCALLASLFPVRAGLAQSPATVAAAPACTLPTPAFVTGAPNIFNDRQEQDLGDALAEYFESDMHLAPMQAANGADEMTRIGEKLLATLPPTGVHYRFRIYDSGEVNGFSLVGGRVYISRKLVTAVKNEDELAGVLAHEIGHISTHQSAIEFTRMLRVRLGVTQVSDRADIFAKMHRLFSTPEKSGDEQDKEKEDQLIADRVALYAMVRAGYAPNSFVSFLNESTMNKGKTGNWLSDAFGLTHEDSQRYRTALKLISQLPAGCMSAPLSSNAGFLAWRRSVVEDRVKAAAEGLTGDQPVKLDPPLRPSLWRIRFSPDGKYLLAQDEAGISIVDRTAAKALFRIDAPDVEEAQFTPDSQSVVFHDTKLRVERWDIASQKRIGVQEMVVFDGCDETLLTPDGNTLVCATVSIKGEDAHLDLRLIDVDSGKPYFEKPRFYSSGSINAINPRDFEWQVVQGARLTRMMVSPDGRFLVVMVMNSEIAFDLEHRQPVPLHGWLKEMWRDRVSFYGSDQMFLIGEATDKGLRKSKIVSFPDGDAVKELESGNEGVDATSKGHTVIAGPLKDYAVGILDPDAHKFIAMSKFTAIDAWDDWIAMEGSQGGVVLGQTGHPQTTQVALPMASLPAPRAAALSPDGKYLAVSLRHRADVWDLSTGKQLSVIRPFESAWIDKDNHLFGRFPKYVSNEPAILELTMSPFGAKNLDKLDSADWQYRNVQIRLKPLGKDGSTTRHVALQVKGIQSQTVAWSRDFPKEAPACWHAEDDRLVLAWDLNSDAARDEVKNSPDLQREAAVLKKKGLLLETVVPETGVPLEKIVIPEADLTKGRDDVRRATVSGDIVLAQGEHGNTVIYRMKDASKIGEFFGETLAADAQSGVIVAINRDDEILLVDERTGAELQRLRLGSPVRLAKIVPSAGKTESAQRNLMVLTADQVMHRLPLPQRDNVASQKQ